MPAKERNFTIQGSDIGFTGGHYKSSTPYNAGTKAGGMLFRMIQYGVKYNTDKKKYAKYAKFASLAKYANEKKIKFILRETTQDSNKKSYYYEVAQTKLKTPIIVNRNGVEIKIEKKISIKACKEQ